MTSLPPENSRQPIVNLPGIVTGFIAVLVVVHLWRMWFLTSDEDFELLFYYALIPARWTMAFTADGFSSVVKSIHAGGGGIDEKWQLSMAQALSQDASARLWTVITHAFLHGSWLHLGFNAIWLAAFGAPLARRWGAPWFAVFCMVTAVMGALAHFIALPYRVVPAIGASGIVSGVFGTVAWYVFNRHLGQRWIERDLSVRPRFAFSEVLRSPTAMVFMIVWLAGNYAFATVPEAFTEGYVGIVWQTHFGGFVGGFLLFPLIDDRIPKDENQ